MYIAILLGSVIFSILTSRKPDFAGTFLITTFSLQLIAIVGLGVSGGVAFINKRSALKDLLSETEKQATLIFKLTPSATFPIDFPFSIAIT